MLAKRKLRRRIDDALATASPLALAEAMDSHISTRSCEELRGMIERSLGRMDAGDRAQLALYLNPEDPDDLLGYRFSAFLRQNPRAISALDPQAVDTILAELGEIPRVDHPVRRLPARTAAIVAIVLAVALLPLAAQYAHQRGLLQGLTEPLIPPPIVPFVQTLGVHKTSAAPLHRRRSVAHHRPVRRRIVAHRSAPFRRAHRSIAQRPRVRRPARVAWKFDRRNNPYFNRERWRYPYVADASPFGTRARWSVRAYLSALVEGNLSAALVRLGLPPNGNTNALGELPIITRATNVAIVGSKLQNDGSEQVQADITTAGREYFAVFSVTRDGPAIRIVDHYYIPVNRRAQIAARATRTE
ncbi:MAG TPA: hypothetical protein VJP85_01840 [Candidatus Baltobacteraceae bacterium]|nr:hypothetical protein [Candidatus Baltobacteraceae bacterium]